MKTKTILASLLVPVLIAGITSDLSAQDKKKKYSIYMNYKKDGKKISIDTTFSSREDMESFMKSHDIDLPTVPPIPPMPDNVTAPEPPALPELPEMPDISIYIDKQDLTEEQKAEIKAEMENAKKEMRKAKKEIEKAKVEIERSRPEIEKAMNDLDKMEIEIENINGDEQIRIIHLEDESSVNIPEEHVLVKIMDSDEPMDGSQLRHKFISVSCDSLEANGKKIVMVKREMPGHVKKRKIKSEQRSKETLTAVNDNDKVMGTTVAEPKSETTDYKLKATDFKVYPNPSNGKINLSFTTEQTETVHVNILDSRGRHITTDSFEPVNGVVNREYDLGGNSRGTYLVQVKQGDSWRHEKVMLK
jgi:hypothetical protein